MSCPRARIPKWHPRSSLCPIVAALVLAALHNVLKISLPEHRSSLRRGRDLAIQVATPKIAVHEVHVPVFREHDA